MFGFEIIPLEKAQDKYLAAQSETRAAAEEHARARVALVQERRSLHARADDVAVLSMRSAFATKRWETCLRREDEALTHYNLALRSEVKRCRSEGRFRCAAGEAVRPLIEERP